jgi:hypothetical protein
VLKSCLCSWVLLAVKQLVTLEPHICILFLFCILLFNVGEAVNSPAGYQCVADKTAISSLAISRDLSRLAVGDESGMVCGIR